MFYGKFLGEELDNYDDIVNFQFLYNLVNKNVLT
jgi:hypothetical protein